MTEQTQVEINPRRIYLTADEILAEKIYICSYENCFAMLHNLAHLQMHLTRHHKAPAINLQSLNDAAKPERTHFYCPHVSCPYYQTSEESTNGARYFGSLRSLKQHYLKVHGERKHRCETCEKSFATESYLRHHRLSCGQKFTCNHCSYTYGSREALLTHAKRKRHGYEELLSAKKPHRGKPTKQVSEVKCVSTGTQTLSELLESKTTQTISSITIGVEAREDEIRLPVETVPTVDQTNPVAQTIENMESLTPVVCTETQTDFIDVMFSHTENRHDPLLSYAHMYTQTSDEQGLFADLGLATTETQTSWTEESETFGDYLVSTETQTNFDIDSFDCSSNSIGDKTDPTSNSKYTQVPEAMTDEFHLLRGASSFLNDIADSIDDHRAVHTQTS